MEDLVIEALADEFKLESEYIYSEWLNGKLKVRRKMYEVQLKDDIEAVARVIMVFRPDYDIRLFYSRSGYRGTHPVHSRS